ncbi:hypothetical protein QMK30_28180, partial [Streptomyces sp. H27-C3]|nr:hypothetical protein [Streptomyces sp. H27-C3]
FTPPRPSPPPPPPSSPRPPSRSPVAHPGPKGTQVALPTYRRATRQEPRGGPSLVSLTLLVTAPAVFAAAVLRPRSR